MVGLRLVREEGWRSVRGGRWWYNGPSLSPGQTQRGVKSKRRQQTLLSLKYLSIRYALGYTLPVCAPHCLDWGKGQFWDHPWFADPTPHIHGLQTPPPTSMVCRPHPPHPWFADPTPTSMVCRPHPPHPSHVHTHRDTHTHMYIHITTLDTVYFLSHYTTVPII